MNQTTGIVMAGVGRVTITPPVGVSLFGYNARTDPSIGVESDLTATILVLSGEKTTLAVGAMDLCELPNDLGASLRDKVADSLGIPASSVMLNVSHTHSGPSLRIQKNDDGQCEGNKQQYLDDLHKLLAEAAVKAKNSLQPARVAAEIGQARIAMHRREWYEGRMIIGSNPDVEIDPDVFVMRVDELDGTPIAVLFSYACHPCLMGPHSLLISPDYPGAARRTIESVTGAAALFLQGASGDQNPITGCGAGPVESDLFQMKRLGNMLAGEVIKVFSGMMTHKRKGARRIYESMSIQALWPFEDVRDEQPLPLAVETLTLDLPLRPLPELSEAEAAEAIFRDRLESSIANRAPAGRIAVDKRLSNWAKDVVKKVEGGDRHQSVPLFVQTFRIGDIAIVGIPGEPFSSTAMDVKKRSPFKHTVFLGYCNGMVGYIPAANAFPPGNIIEFEKYRIPDMTYQNSDYLSPPTPAWENTIVGAAVELLNYLVQGNDSA